MISNAEIKFIRSLKEKKFRDEHRLFVVEGEKMVAEAQKSRFKVERIFRTEDIGQEAMARITMLSTPSPVLALVRIPEPSFDGSLAPGLSIGLDTVKDPGNMGTILRICDWFGISTIYASRGTVELFNPKVVQATMGAIFRKRVIYCDLPELCDAFLAAGRPVYGTFLDGGNIYTADLNAEGLIVMGNESNGISPEVAAKVSSRLHIPSFTDGPTSESLNVAIATAITVSEFRRR